MDSEATPTECGRLSAAFVMPPSLDSKTENYISIVAHCASHSRQRKATERSENATSRPITHYHVYRKYTERIPPYSGPAAVVLSTFRGNENFCCKQQSSVYLVTILHHSTYSMLA